MRSVLDHTPVLSSARRDVSGENSLWGDPGSWDGADAYWRLVRPRLSKLLEFLHLDVVFDRASGAYLWPRSSAEPVLDLIGGYGTFFFGHNRPELTRAAVA